MKKYTLSIILCLLMLMPAAQAQRSLMEPQPLPPASEMVPVPKDWQKLWVIKTCEKGKMGYRFSDYFLQVSVAGGSKLFRIGGFKDNGNGRYSMVMPGETVQLLQGTQNNLIQIFGTQQANFSVEALEKKKIMVPHIYFENCEGVKPGVVQENEEMRALLPRLDQIHKNCPTRPDISKKECQRAIFGLFDSSSDGFLDQKEMEYGWDVAINNSSFGTCGSAATPADMLRREGAEYFAWIFKNLDKNTDQKISFDEIYGQWEVMAGDALMSGATNLLISAEKPIGLLPPEIHATCVNCCIATP